MGRVLKITGGLLGVLLLIITGSLMARRDENLPLRYMLVRVSDWNVGNGFQQFYWIEPESGLTRAISPRHEQLYLVSHDATWLYYMGYDLNAAQDSYDVKLYRTRLGAAAFHPQVVASGFQECWGGCTTTVTDTPAVVFSAYDAHGDLQLYRVVGGDPAERLTPLDLRLPLEYSPFNFAVMGEWVVFNGTPVNSTTSTSMTQVYRVPITGGSAINLTPDMSDAAFVYWPVDEAAGVVANFDDGNLYQVALDENQPPRPLTTSGHDWASVAKWLKQSRILIVQSASGPPTDDWVAAVAFDTRAVLWEVAARYGAVSDDEQRVVVIQNMISATGDYLGHELVEIQTADGQSRLITEMQGSYIQQVWGWTADGQWILFTTYAANVNDTTLWRVAAAGGTAQKISIIGGAAFFEDWTADGMGGIYTDYGHMDANFSKQIGVHDTEPQLLMPNYLNVGSVEFLDWVTLRPSRFQPELLLVAGGGLCFLFFIPNKRQKRTEI